MSNQKSKRATPDQLRFSGPELSELLDRVMKVHGEEAAITEVNRVRSGGVAGFFCREEFEVVVDPDDAPAVLAFRDSTPAEAEVDGEVAGESLVEGDEPPGERDHAPVEVGDDAPGEVGDAAVDGDGARAEGHTEVRDEARVDDAGAGGEPTSPEGTEGTAGSARTGSPVATSAARPEVFAGPTSPGARPGDRSADRFMTLLERRLDERSAAERELTSRQVDSWAPAPAEAAERPRTDRLDRAPQLDPARPSPFWQRLNDARDELASFLPADAPVTAVIGPLPLALSVVHRLRASGPLSSATVVVLTDRAGIVAEPSWTIVRSASRLVEQVGDRLGHRADGQASKSDGIDGAPEPSPPPPTVIVIDAPTTSGVPSWIGSLQHRLRIAGVGLFRYAVAGQPTGADLEPFRQGADVPYAIDLVSRVEPARLVELVADRHPIVSVAGADLGSELLLALRHHLAHAPGRELTDG